MKRLTKACRALQYAMALGSIVALLASCGSEVDPNANTSLSDETIATDHEALASNNGDHDVKPATRGLVLDTSLKAQNCTATTSWSKGFGDASGQSVKGTATDGSNNVVIAGDNLGTLNFGGVPLASAGSSDVFVAKFDSAGNHLWSKQFGDASSQNTVATDIDSAGNIVVTGLLDGTIDFGGGPLTTAGLLDVFLVKFDANGNHLWSKRFGDSTTQNAGSVAIDNAGNVVIAGSFVGSIDFGGGSLVSAGVTDIFVAKFDPSGNHLWSKRFGNSSGQNANGVAVDGSGNVLFTGLFAGAMSFGGSTLTSAGGNDIYLTKLDASGNHVWSKSFGTTGNEVPRGIATDNAGNVVITGLVTTTIDFGGGLLTVGGSNDGFVAKFDGNGNHVWSRAFGDSNPQIFISAATDSSNNVIIGGQFVGTLDMGGGPFTNAGGLDAFVAKFTPNGTHIWSQSFGSTAGDVPQASAVDSANNVVLAGDFGATIDFGNGPLVNAGSTDAFVVKLVPCVPVPLGGSCTSNGNCGSGFCDPAGNICACDENADCTGIEVCNTVANPNKCTVCGNGMLEPGEVCDDGNFNNGDGCSNTCLHELGGTCGSDNQCVNNTCTDGVCCQAFFCGAQDQCHNPGTCQAGTGTCFYPNKADGSSCDDGDACTQSDTCISGTCTGANAITCSASDQCHDVGTCNPSTGICSNPNKADGSSCNDGDACTQSDTCSSGTCTGSNPISCAASDQCHNAGTCDPMTGTCSNPSKADGSSCNDGDACTQSDTCISGTCTGSNPISCAASDQCHDVGTCNPSTGICSNPNKADGSSCNDGDACTQSDTCISGTCTGSNPISCAASDQCHDVGTCNPSTGICSNPNKADGSTCDDSNACTQSDTCIAGTCTGSNPVACSALDQCHDAGTCDSMTGLCSNPSKADGSSCNDGDACTQSDTCLSGTCTGANPIQCTASETCHDGGTCDPATGICSGPISADGTSCNDNNACTQLDTCLSGTCTGTNPIACLASDECEIAGSCNPATGACDNTAKADGTFCSHGICQQGKCIDQCEIDSDCGELFECTRFHQCQPLTVGPLDSGANCACKTVGAPGMPGQTSAIPLVALAAYASRRRRCKYKAS